MQRKTRRPFKGPTPDGVFQTVDVGYGGEEWLRKRAVRFAKRKYVGVNPSFGKEGLAWLKENLERSGMVVRPEKIMDFADEMKSRGWRTRHINIDMPGPEGALKIDKYDFPKFFRDAPRLLLPGGKIFISSENTAFLGRLATLARENGFSSSAPRAFTNPRQMRTEYMKSRNAAGGAVYRVVMWQRRPKAQ